MRAIRFFFAAAPRRRGSIVVLAAIVMVVILAFLAFSLDVGYMSMTRSHLQNYADAAAMAAAQELNPNADQAVVQAKARQAAYDVIAANSDASTANSFFDKQLDVQFGKQTWDPQSQKYSYQWGDTYTPYNIVKVLSRRDQRPGVNSSTPGQDQRLPLFIAPVLGNERAIITTSAVATYQPRDIMVVLDYSGSMCYDSRLMRISLLGRTMVENNLLQIWQDLGSPTYGNMTFQPQYAVLRGQPLSGLIPHIDVTYQGTAVAVTSTSNITSVRLQFSNGGTQTISGSGKTGTFSGTGSNNGKTISTAWVKSGSNAGLSSGNYGEQFSFTTANLKLALGLTLVPYPYPSGNWDEFIGYCQTSSDVVNAGYKNMFGYMLWVNYLQDWQRAYSETPDLWKTSEQPITILKNGVDLFIDYITSVEADDNVGLSVYSTGDSTGAKLEAGLSRNLAQIKTISRQRQAGHYDPYTNISAGMTLARQQLQSNARPNAFRMMVVMTDGVVNRPVDATTGYNMVLTEAKLAADAKIKILTISMGVLADANLMQQVADITGGTHYNVPGGADVATYQKQLLDAFHAIAASRPLKLINGN